uniref:Uncharacterized protein n=1 Tax=Anguilla anguilla TaxID=7936 RepID=A0A0E9PFS1_ANGAN
MSTNLILHSKGILTSEPIGGMGLNPCGVIKPVMYFRFLSIVCCWLVCLQPMWLVRRWLTW